MKSSQLHAHIGTKLLLNVMNFNLNAPIIGKIGKIKFDNGWTIQDASDVGGGTNIDDKVTFKLNRCK